MKENHTWLTRAEILAGLGRDHRGGRRYRPRRGRPSEKSFTDDLDIDSLSMVEIVGAGRGEVRRARSPTTRSEPEDRRRRRRLIAKNQSTPPLARGGTYGTHPRSVTHEHRYPTSSSPGSARPPRSAGTSPSTWDGAARRPVRRPAHRRADHEWVERLRAARAVRARRCAVDPTEVLDRVEAAPARPVASSSRWSRPREAWADAGLAGRGRPASGSASWSAPASAARWTLLDQDDMLEEQGLRRVSPLTVPMLMPNGPAARRLAGARRPRRRPRRRLGLRLRRGGASASALRHDPGGRADMVIAGGTEAAIHPLPSPASRRCRRSRRATTTPARASRPTTSAATASCMGEGAGVMVLERAEHAAARGARIYGRFAGVGMSADAHHITAPEPEGAGASRAMREARERRRARPATTSSTSTPTPRRPRSATWPRRDAIRRAFGATTDGASPPRSR